jgi:hypothetical protein
MLNFGIVFLRAVKSHRQTNTIVCDGVPLPPLPYCRLSLLALVATFNENLRTPRSNLCYFIGNRRRQKPCAVKGEAWNNAAREGIFHDETR